MGLIDDIKIDVDDLKSTKTAIKQSLIGQGADMSDVPFTQYYRKIDELGNKPHELRAFNINGSITSSTRYSTGENATFPTPPINTYLTFVNWTHIQSELNNMRYRDSERGLLFAGHIDIGATYRTTDDRTHIFASIRSNYSMSISLQFSKVGTTNAMINIDWGDGSPVEKYSIAAFIKTHLYSTEEDYHIQVWTDDNLEYAMGNGNSTTSVVTVGKECITKIYFSDYVLLKPYACYQFKNLVEVSLPPLGLNNTITNYMFDSCNNLPHINIPREYESIGQSAFNNCYNLISIVIPSTVLSLGPAAFYLTPKIQRLVLPRGMDTFSDNLFNLGSAVDLITDTIRVVGQNAFNAWYLLKYVNLANTVYCGGTGTFTNAYSITLTNLSIIYTSAPSASALSWNQSISGTITLGGNGDYNLPVMASLNSCTKLVIKSNFIAITGAITSAAIKTYVFERETPLTLSNASYLANINKLAKIYVPDTSVTAYKTAPVWSTYAAYIHPLSEMEI